MKKGRCLYMVSGWPAPTKDAAQAAKVSRKESQQDDASNDLRRPLRKHSPGSLEHRLVPEKAYQKYCTLWALACMKCARATCTVPAYWPTTNSTAIKQLTACRQFVKEWLRLVSWGHACMYL